MKLTLTNDFNTPRWYVFPPIFGDTLPSDGFFYSPQDTPFVESRKFPAERSNLQIVETRFFGTDSPAFNSFLAFYLPPRSTIVLENYYVLMHESALSQSMEVWEVETLLVDGSTPFEQWRPFDLLCSGNVHLKLKTIGSVSLSRHLDLDYMEQHGADNPSKARAAHVQAKGIKKLSIKIWSSIL
ncbi:hypothetical protein HUU42_04795 [bacterium]|nr:hypothetical protein [bacterium]